MRYAFWPRGRRARVGLVAVACAVGAVTAAMPANAGPPPLYPAPANVWVTSGGALTWSPVNGAIGYEIFEDGPANGVGLTTTATQWQLSYDDGKAHTFQVSAIFNAPSGPGVIYGNESLPVSEPPLNIRAQNPSGPNHVVCWDAVVDHDGLTDAYFVSVYVLSKGTFRGQVSGDQTCFDFSQIVPAALKGFSVEVTVISASDIKGNYQAESDPSAIIYPIYG